jgi:hypothetical protein
MARKISSGLVGQPSVGGINVSSLAVISSAENQNITLGPLGNGSVVFTNNAILNAQNDLRFADADSSNYVALQAPATITSNYTLTLPNTDGSNNQVLTTNGSGTLSWTTASVSITDNTSDSAIHYPAITTATSGSINSARVTSTKFTFQPSTGILTTTELTVNGTARSLRTENGKTANHTLELADRNKVVAFTGSAAQTITVPPDSTVNFPVGSVVYIGRFGTGSLDLAAGTGVTLTKTGSFSSGEEIYVRKRAANSWSVADAPQKATGSGGTISATDGYTVHSYTSVGSSTFSLS